MNGERRRVVVTGMGIVSPLGNVVETFWESLLAGRSGVRPMSGLPIGTLPMSIAAEASDFSGKIVDFEPLQKNQKKAIRKGLKVMCRECQMGIAAAQKALADGQLTPGSVDPERIGVSFGSDYMVTIPEEFIEGVSKCVDDEGRFEFSRWAREGMPQMSPLWLLKYLPNMPASHLAIYNDLRGPNNSITLREASPNVVAWEACQIIRRNWTDLMLTGSTGTRIHPLKTVHAVQQGEVAPGGDHPTEVSRPFDRDRTGMVLGEGAGAILLEELSSAQARDVPILGEILGGASVSVVGRKMVADRRQAMRNALVGALKNADLAPDQIGFVHAHGLSTRSGDVEEAQAIHEVFGTRSKPVPVTTAKGHFGNLGAGSGMIELIAGIRCLEADRVFPVLNYENPDPECPISVVTNGDTPAGNTFVALGVTPQGQASALVVGRFGS